MAKKSYEKCQVCNQPSNGRKLCRKHAYQAAHPDKIDKDSGVHLQLFREFATLTPYGQQLALMFATGGAAMAYSISTAAAHDQTMKEKEGLK